MGGGIITLGNSVLSLIHLMRMIKETQWIWKGLNTGWSSFAFSTDIDVLSILG